MELSQMNMPLGINLCVEKQQELGKGSQWSWQAWKDHFQSFSFNCCSFRQIQKKLTP